MVLRQLVRQLRIQDFTFGVGGGGANLRRGHLSAEMLAKMKELGPVGGRGGAGGTPLELPLVKVLSPTCGLLLVYSSFTAGLSLLFWSPAPAGRVTGSGLFKTFYSVNLCVSHGWGYQEILKFSPGLINETNPFLADKIGTNYKPMYL